MTDNIYIYSDTHFGHDKIRQYEERPFGSIEEMDKVLIQNWNKEVHKRGEVYFLGDFSFYPFDKTKEIFDRLNGRKHLIMGNHDRAHTRTWWKRIGFDIVINNPIIFYKEKLILSHEPIKAFELPNYWINIHGHIHTKKLDSWIYPIRRYINISADATDFKPVKLSTLLEREEICV